MDCFGCGLCCQLRAPCLEVRLTPEEADKFLDSCSYRRGFNGERAWWMDREKNGDCVHFDPVDRVCSVYGHRPEECRRFGQDRPVCGVLLGLGSGKATCFGAGFCLVPYNTPGCPLAGKA